MSQRMNLPMKDTEGPIVRARATVPIVSFPPAIIPMIIMRKSHAMRTNVNDS